MVLTATKTFRGEGDVIDAKVTPEPLTSHVADLDPVPARERSIQVSTGVEKDRESFGVDGGG